MVDRPLESVDASVRAALAEQGFGVLTEIDVAATLRAKLGIERSGLKILGACNPTLANRALETDEAVALLLPCNVVLADRGSRTEVSIVDPRTLLSSPGLNDLAEDAVARLSAALDALEGVEPDAEGPTGAGGTRPLSQDDYEAIYARVPRLTVEVVIVGPEGVLLTRRAQGPCAGLWHLPGGTVRFGEPLAEAVVRVAEEELGASVSAGELFGYIEYPSHIERGLDCPVGMAFESRVSAPERPVRTVPGSIEWFTRLPEPMHEEQRNFLRAHELAT
jgi:uncharacterized protein (DUF302 family)/ADP-ribose pyrophosphatase YjhB (NUDIX family)